MSVVNAQPAWWRVPLGVPLAGRGEGVGDCRGAVVLQSGVPFGSPGSSLGEVSKVRFYGTRFSLVSHR